VTLVELMIVVAILAVLAAIGAPNLRAFFINNRLATANNDFMAALSLARSESIRRGASVSVRRASTTAREWTEGWEIFVDANGNGVRDAGDELIRVGQPLARSLTLRASQVVEAFVPFTADGRVALSLDDGANPLNPRATFVLCYDGVLHESGQSRSRAVLLNSAGRARPGTDSNGDGRPENAIGADITSCATPS
jgi:type IV fimbrial biogenesis protein FimT